MFAEVVAVRVPGRVVWCNFDLARELGFDVPSWPRMTRALHDQLLDALSWRVLQPGEDPAGRPTITLYADHYGGDGIFNYLGSARAAFTPYGDILVKGIGLTPLYQPDEGTFQHSHGGCNMNEALAEAVQAEISHHLFRREPARILAVIDQDDYTIYPGGRTRRARAVVARAGMQLRPAHILASEARRSGRCRELFVRITGETGQLVERNGAPDLKATMLQVMDDHADAAAEQVRWRVTHGCISTSNMLMSGGMLDVVLQTAHPRIAGIAVPHGSKNPDRLYFRDYADRVRQMGKVYRVLRRSLAPDERRHFHAAHIDEQRVMSKAYHRHLGEAMLRAAGLKGSAAVRMRERHPDLVRRFREVMVQLAELKNPGSVRDWHARLDRLAVVDILRLLHAFPPIFFADPRADHRAAIARELDPVYRGNRHLIRRNRRSVRRLVREFATVYAQLMAACAELEGEYNDAATMQRSIAERAAFENAVLARADRDELYAEVEAEIERYKADGDASRFDRMIRHRIAASSRNVDALLHASPPRRLSDGSIELNPRFADGVRCSVRAWPDGTRRLLLRIQLRRVRNRYVTSLPHDLPLLPDWIPALTFRYTTDGGATFDECRAVLRRDEIVFEDVLPRRTYGELSGSLTAGEITLGDVHDYPYALPDAAELRALEARTRTKARLSSG